MKTIFCAVWLAVLATGCSYFKWGQSDQPWTEPAGKKSTNNQAPHPRDEPPAALPYK